MKTYRDLKRSAVEAYAETHGLNIETHENFREAAQALWAEMFGTEEDDGIEYRVTWQFDEIASNPLEAIAQAIKRMPRENDESTATVFTVETMMNGTRIKTQDIDIAELSGADLKLYLKCLNDIVGAQ